MHPSTKFQPCSTLGSLNRSLFGLPAPAYGGKRLICSAVQCSFTAQESKRTRLYDADDDDDDLCTPAWSNILPTHISMNVTWNGGKAQLDRQPGLLKNNRSHWQPRVTSPLDRHRYDHHEASNTAARKWASSTSMVVNPTTPAPPKHSSTPTQAMAPLLVAASLQRAQHAV